MRLNYAAFTLSVSQREVQPHAGIRFPVRSVLVHA